MQTFEQKIHAHKSNEARRDQLLAFEDELQWADRQPPTPRPYKPQLLTVKQAFLILRGALNITRFYP